MTRRSGWRGIAAGLAIALLTGGAPAAAWAADDPAADSGGTIAVTVPERSTADITDAELRWGVNHESGGGSFVGGCNFLSAGAAPSSGEAKPWTAADGLYRATSGSVRIVKATAAGGWAAASFASKCLDSAGDPVDVNDVSSFTDTQVVMSGGLRAKDADGTLRIRWTGSFTVAFYGGMSYWSATDPVLTMDASGNGRLTAAVSGYATSQTDLGKWQKVSSPSVVLADIRGARMLAGGFAQAPQYAGVTASIDGQIAKSPAGGATWGAFPASFLGFMQRLGQGGYWMSTGGQRDAAKPATTLYVNYDAAHPAVDATTAPPSSGGSGAGGGGQPGGFLQTTTVTAGAVSSPPASVAAPAAIVRGPVPASVSRAAAALVPTGRGVVPAWALPAAATLLAVLVAVLAGLDLAGFRIRLWPRRHPSSS